MAGEPGQPVEAGQKRVEDAADHLHDVDVIVAGVDQVSARSYINKYSIKTLTPYFDAGSIIKTDDEDGVTSMHGYIQTVVLGVSACSTALIAVTLTENDWNA